MQKKYFDIVNGKTSIKCKMYAKDLQNIDTITLSCHGFCGTKEVSVSKKLAESLSYIHNGNAVLAFDWPCHGEDVRQNLNLEICDEYITNIINYIRNEMGIDVINVQATSFGGYLIMKYIKEHGNPFERIGLRCPAIDMYTTLTENILTDEGVDMIMKGKNVTVGHDRKLKITKEFLKELYDNRLTDFDYSIYTDNIVIAQGDSDEIVSCEFNEQFCDDNILEFYKIEGADHRFQNPALAKKALEVVIECIKTSLEQQKIR